MVERHPDGVAHVGYRWLDTRGKVLHVPELHLEFTEEPAFQDRCLQPLGHHARR